MGKRVEDGEGVLKSQEWGRGNGVGMVGLVGKVGE